MDANKSYDYSAYLGHNRPTDISELSKLAESQHAAQVKVDNLTAQLKLAQDELKELAEKIVPEKMEEFGLSDYTTTTGIRIEVKEKIRGSLPAENREKGFNWLETKGFGGLIKTEVLIPFKRGQLDEANKLAEKLREENHIVGVERDVHHSTLDAFIREQLAQGNDIPLDIFGVFRQRIAKVEI